MRACLLFSGGLDCVLAYFALVEKGIVPDLLYVRIGDTKVEDFEIEASRKLLPYLKESPKFIVDSNHLNIQDFTLPTKELPLRNMYLAMVAVNLGYDEIYFGFQSVHDSLVRCFADARKPFAEKLSSVLSLGTGRDIIIDSPLFDLTKEDAISEFLAKGNDSEILKISNSCFENEKQCGVCSSCVRKAVAMFNSGLDISFFDSHPFRSDFFLDRVDKMDTLQPIPAKNLLKTLTLLDEGNYENIFGGD